MDFGLTGSRVVDPTRGWDGPEEVWVQAGQRVGPHETTVTDGTGWVSGPGLVDLYAHSGEPGHERRETLASLAAAAQAGGYQRLTLLPDTRPALDQVNILRALHNTWASPVQLGLLAAMTLGQAGEQTVEAGELAPWVVGFTDAQPVGNWRQLRNFLEYVQPLARPVFVYAREGQLTQGVAREGATALALGLAGVPEVAETSGLQTLLALVRLTGTPVHVMRLATAGGVYLIRQAKQEGLPVTASVTVSHLIHTEDELWSLDPHLRFDPPLGSNLDRAALLAGLRDGTVDAIATDHTPWTYAEKTLPFTQTPAGSIMLELSLSLLWSRLVALGDLEALTLWTALSTGPRRILGLTDDTPGAMGWVAFNPAEPWQVNHQNLHSLSPATPWWGEMLQGRVCRMWF
ncbi:dihydroorotase [Candidatus Cyanaurora vandensis]|uniref:dihydroorotase n=1 Tax=Candidatus Cyanaurora vandensis TaxID=2714958 RepID=UPI00257AA2F8|nr:dihydroorotase [Candidatus Cyanaurora vandensis]